jgi:rhodanese-related sulfurtransferase
MGDRDESFAFLLLRGESYRNVSVLDGGYDEWVKQGYPVEKGTQ